MIEINGKYNKANVFIDDIEKETYKQILAMCNLKQLETSTIRIMPDCHAGAGCTIGTTIRMPHNTPINPYYVGVDIGCGVEVVKLEGSFSFQELDEVIRKNVPYGFQINDHEEDKAIELINNLFCKEKLRNLDRLYKSLGTLGGGNHFIEIAENKDRERFLLIHSGSRNLGHQVATIYGKMADKDGFLTGELVKDYLHDMNICQHYAEINRILMVSKIVVNLNLTEAERECTTIHNYIEMHMDCITLRKGAVRAMKDEKLVIPLNMRDGTILAKGKENLEWNCSAPHGAGRILSRSQAKKILELSEFIKEMNGVYTTCVSKETLDEAPMAYKSMSMILENISETVEIIDVLKPVYNFKASEK